MPLPIYRCTTRILLVLNGRFSIPSSCTLICPPTKPQGMAVESYTLSIRTRREGEMVDITDRVQDLLGKAKPTDGVAFLFVPGSTGALTTIEYEGDTVGRLC